ncbi:MAG: hypothetical protein HY840_13050 [Bacteroidetes bacterium]|nr:hypothetical protein [Bacteroidota bacterium]
MKKVFLLTFFLFIATFLHAGIIIAEGKYQNKNLFIQNAYEQAGVGFSVYAVYVNGKLTNDEINSSAFEIDLSQLQLKYGQDVIIKIFHRDGSVPPRVLNPDALKPIPTFEVIAMKMTNEGLLTWTANKEGGPLPYLIEQFRWNKWVYVGEVQGIGTAGEHSYTFQVTALHSGENRFRIKQAGYQAKYSHEIRIISSTPRCIYSMSKGSKQIDFTCGTLFEVYDYYGSIVKKGYGSRVDIANLQKGGYYICFDNSIAEIKKK